MKNPTLTEIRKSVEAAGGEYKKLKTRLNGQDSYIVNGRMLSKEDMIVSYKLGMLL
jgi:Cu2+-containing amine oxidase